MKRLLLFVIVAFLFNVGNKAQSSFNADDVVALKSLMSTGVNPGLFEKIWVGQDAQKPNPSDENDTQWEQVDWETDIKGLTWNDSGELLKIDWSNFGAPETDYITGLLSVADLKHLKTFHCYNNGLTGLILKNLPQLNGIEIGYNEIVNFMTDATPAIDSIDLINNKLTKLTLTGYPNLEYLNCSHNKLTALEVNSLSGLKLLDCGENELTSLDISNLQNIENLFCYDNKLSELAVYTSAPWNELSCGDNNLPFSQLPAESEISGDYKYTPQILTATVNEGESYTFDKGSHTGTIGVASCTKEDGTELTGYKIENATFTPPPGFSGKLVAYVTHSDFPKFNTGGYEYDYMELHLTVEATEKYNVVLPEVEGLEITPAPGTYEVGKGDYFEFTLTLMEGYEESEVKVYTNGDLLQPNPTTHSDVVIRSFIYTIENITEAITITIEGVKKNDPSNIESPLSNQDYQVYTEGTMLYIDSQKQDRFVVYSMEGKKYAGGELPVGITSVSLPKGFYIVLIGENRLKIAIGN